MAEIGTVLTGALKNSGINVSMDESICGLLFDIGSDKGVFTGYRKLLNNFSDNQVHLISNLKDAAALGIEDNGFLNGVLYYHIKWFYDYLGQDQDLYICLSDCSENFDALELMIIESGSRIFQIGVWTNQAIWTNVDGAIDFSQMVKNLGAKTQSFVGTENNPEVYLSPINVILQGYPGFDNSDVVPDYKYIPYCSNLELCKLSILLGQRAGAKNNIGMIGLAMACLSKSYAEESIAYLKKFNLNKDDEFDVAELGFGANNTPINEINSIQQSILALKNYIFPITYEAKAGCVYLCSDATMSDGDYGTIRASRIMHKVKRAFKMALFPHVNGNIVVVGGQIASSDIASIKNDIANVVDNELINPEGNFQISNYSVSIDPYQDVLDTDSIAIKCTITMLEPAKNIDFEEYLIKEEYYGT